MDEIVKTLNVVQKVSKALNEAGYVFTFEHDFDGEERDLIFHVTPKVTLVADPDEKDYLVSLNPGSPNDWVSWTYANLDDAIAQLNELYATRDIRDHEMWRP